MPEIVMVFLFRLIFFIAIIYLVRFFLVHFFGTRRRPAEKAKDSSTPGNQMVKDPVCGMYMDPRLAIKLDNRNGTFYFCSEKCRTKYLDVSSGAGISSTAC